MNRSTSIIVAILALALPALASESFILDIPVRGNAQQETGKVRLVLGLSAAPAGAQLVVSGSTTVNLGSSATVNGDSVSFTAGTGNQAVIVYQPLSNFAGDFCTAPSPTEKQVPMRFSGPQDVVDFRTTTYIVAAPNAECSQASKHTGDTPAFVTPQADGVAPALNAIDKGRNTFDIALVLDKSGSMADPPPGANNPPNKAAILISAVQAFAANWEQIDLPTPSGAEWSHDRIGMVFFDSTPSAQSLPGADPPANFWLERGGGNAWDGVINGVAGLTPSLNTSIGAGVNTAMQQWKNDPQNDLSLVVVTDGMQNTPPLILPTGTGFLGLDPVAGFPQELRKRFVPIQTIGFGLPAQVDQTLLQNMAYETSGVSFMDANASTMFDSFAMTLISLLKGNTASIGARWNKTLPGVQPSGMRPVVVDKSAQRVVFSLQWAPPAANALDLEVYKPGSATVATPFSKKKIPQASIQTFNLTPGDAGTWMVRVKRGSKRMKSPVPYSMHVFFLEKGLDFQLTPINLKALAGDKIGIRAVIDWNGKRLSGLPPGSIRAVVMRPAAAPHLKPKTSTKEPRVGREENLELAKEVIRTRPEPVATITLREESKGVYAATFEKTTVPGLYQFNVVLDWNDERAGHVHREEVVEQYLGARRR